MSRDQDIAKCASAAWFEFRALPFLRPRTQGTRTLRRTLDDVHTEMMDLQNQVDTLRANLKGAVGALISVTWPKGGFQYDRHKPDYPYIHEYLLELLGSVNARNTRVRDYKGYAKEDRDRDAVWINSPFNHPESRSP